MAVAKFARPHSTFSSVLKQRVNEYFQQRHIRPTGDWRLYTKTITLVVSGVVFYIGWVVLDLPTWAMVLSAMLLGINHALIGFNVMHDGAHGSFSTNPRLNSLMGYSLNVVGGNTYLWKLKHNVAHHTFPNVEGHDEDIDVWPFIRSSSYQPRLWFHRYQHLYGLVLYCVTYLQWVFWADTRKYLHRNIASLEITTFTTREHFIFWASKAFYIGVFIGVPILVHGWALGIGTYLLSAATTGILIAIVFQLAHVNEATHFTVPEPDTNKVDAEFLVHQMATTANFSTRSKVVAWLLGGLNFQVEHHLFPKISHVHYPAIKGIVESTCREFNVPYLEYPTVRQALASHLRYLRLVGNQA
jgi:linoleoyl-CoA desaturase